MGAIERLKCAVAIGTVGAMLAGALVLAGPSKPVVIGADPESSFYYESDIGDGIGIGRAPDMLQQIGRDKRAPEESPEESREEQNLGGDEEDHAHAQPAGDDLGVIALRPFLEHVVDI